MHSGIKVKISYFFLLRFDFNMMSLGIILSEFPDEPFVAENYGIVRQSDGVTS